MCAHMWIIFTFKCFVHHLQSTLSHFNVCNLLEGWKIKPQPHLVTPHVMCKRLVKNCVEIWDIFICHETLKTRGKYRGKYTTPFCGQRACQSFRVVITQQTQKRKEEERNNSFGWRPVTSESGGKHQTCLLQFWSTPHLMQLAPSLLTPPLFYHIG